MSLLHSELEEHQIENFLRKLFLMHSIFLRLLKRLVRDDAIHCL